MSMVIDLKFPIIRDVSRRGSDKAHLIYTAGSNCIRIDRDATAGWWIIVDPMYRYWVSDEHVQSVEQVADRGYDATPENTPAEKVPDFLTKADDGFVCNRCGKKCPTLHGAKTHYGSHGRE